ncbi:MAG: hypothetical protein RR969_13940, partial [Thermomonas sp.]
MQARLRLADIRAALGQFRRQANGDLTLGLRHGGILGQLRVQGLRRLAHQQAEGIDQLVLALLQIRQARFDGGTVKPYVQVTYDHEFEDTKQASAWVQSLPDVGMYRVPGMDFDK